MPLTDSPIASTVAFHDAPVMVLFPVFLSARCSHVHAFIFAI
jgi:hypothetical protein